MPVLGAVLADEELDELEAERPLSAPLNSPMTSAPISARPMMPKTHVLSRPLNGPDWLAGEVGETGAVGGALGACSLTDDSSLACASGVSWSMEPLMVSCLPFMMGNLLRTSAKRFFLLVTPTILKTDRDLLTYGERSITARSRTRQRRSRRMKAPTFDIAVIIAAAYRRERP